MEFIKKGKDIFRAGLAYDERGEYEKALQCYEKGIGLFLSAIKFIKEENFKSLNRRDCIYEFPKEKLSIEKDKKLKEQIIKTAVDKCKSFLDRAEVIKKHLHEQKKSSGSTSPKSVNNNNNNEDQKKATKSNKDDSELNEEQKELRNSIEDAILKEKPNVKWEDVSGNEYAKKALEEAIILPRQYPQLFVGKRKPWKAVLLYGPPGTGKTYLAKALATRMGSDVTFFSISSSSLVSKWLGESEKLIRSLFEMAIEESPSVIFIDEIDSIASSRENDGGGGNNDSGRRIKTEFMIQINKMMDSNKPVILLAATNRPFDIDTAMRRRFEKRIYIPLPDVLARVGVLKVHARKEIQMTQEQYMNLGEMMKGFSCSDINIAVRNALMIPVRKAMISGKFVKIYNTEQELKRIVPFTPEKVQYKEEETTSEVVEMDLLDIKSENARFLELPSPSFEDLVNSIKTTRPSVNMEDIKMHEKFTEKFGIEG